MLQRIQAVLMVVLLGAVVFLGVQFYRAQQANEAATNRIADMLEQAVNQKAAASPAFSVLTPSELDQLFPRDAKLTNVQRAFRNWSETTFPALDATWWNALSQSQKKSFEEGWLKQLSAQSEKMRELAIKCLTTVGCKRAVPEILKIAAERVEKDNADRCEAVRALGILGDESLVPELVPLTYHYNTNTRLWAQIALVRLTGENFGNDQKAWKTWWDKRGGRPAIPDERVVWAKSEWLLAMLQGCDDPKKQEEMDRQFVLAQRRTPLTTAALPTASQPAVAAAPPAAESTKAGYYPGSKRVNRPKVVAVFPSPDAKRVEPINAIRIKFDRPMDGGKMGIHSNPINKPTPFRLRAAPKYLAESREFVIPVEFQPGVRYDMSLSMLCAIDEKVSEFISTDGVAAEAYSWQFDTRPASPNTKAPKPRVVSIDPPSGAKTGMVVPMRVRFDRPMDPEAYAPVGSIEDEGVKDWDIVHVPFPVEYEASSHTFTFLVFFPRSTTVKIDFRGFRGVDGADAEPATATYDGGKRLYTPEQEAAIAQAGRSLKLSEVVGAVRKNRLSLTSIRETVTSMMHGSCRKGPLGWLASVQTDYGQFGFQGDRQFYADVSAIMGHSSASSGAGEIFRLGSDGRECWFYHTQQLNPIEGVKEITFCPWDEMRTKTVVMADPFGAKRFTSTEQAIKELQLEYMGIVTRNGKTCHRVRSWQGRIHTNTVFGVHDYLIDTETLLPATYVNSSYRYDFSYAEINRPIPVEAFQPAATADVPRKPYKLEEGYEHFMMSACDGSDGRMSARWGQQGAKKGTLSSGLN